MHRIGKNVMNYAIILAGGVGSRFWPLSRAEEPKQFLNICSPRAMIEETIYRIKNLIKDEHIYIATNTAYRYKIRNCIKELNLIQRNVFFEPEGRNTFAPIGFLSWEINCFDPKAVIVVLPCDHFIKYPKKFLNLLKKGMKVAQGGDIVTLGVFPTRPETGYGYIKIKSKLKGQKPKVYDVDRFIEKPILSKVKRFIKDKRYFWNSGIFIFRADVMLGEINKFMPYAHKIITSIKDKKCLNRLWHKLPSTSIDYAIMEKTKKLVLLPADYGWLDLGNWQAIVEIAKKDKNGNVFKCKYNNIDLESRNTLVWSNCRFVATLGLNNAIIVDTKDALLVCAKDKAQEIKSVVKKLAVKKSL